MKSEFRFAKYNINYSAWLKGVFVSLSVVLVFGLLLGNTIDPDSSFSVAITIALSIGILAGGYVAAIYSPRNHIVHGTLTAAPIIPLSLLAQFVRLTRDSADVSWLSLFFTIMLTISLASLGGVIGGRFAIARRSLIK
ncbi:MAG: putative membrane protein (TIGR04086 family) [Candidatus Poriferisodalaceae bacterium]|jgi:putative membrane protein (TIGR04086 family)|tara:strand:- start:3930 stop:4343 length:414 start_codon:yes stop_codon:yes gene_type:complete